MRTIIYQVVLFFLFTTIVFAAPPVGIGSVANNLLGPVSFLSDFLYTTCFIIGGSFIFASIVKYFDHKRNPLAVPMSTVVFLLIAGCALLVLPFANFIIHHGLPYSLFTRPKEGY